MKHLLVTISLFFLVELNAYAGGVIGGVGPAIALEESMMNAAFRLEALPKAYANQDDFRRATARLSKSGVSSTELTVKGESIKVRKLRDSVVNETLSKEILPQ